jgi:hypothetical protein
VSAQFSFYSTSRYLIFESTHCASLFALLKNDHQLKFPPGSFFHDLSPRYLYSPSCYMLVMIKTLPRRIRITPLPFRHDQIISHFLLASKASVLQQLTSPKNTHVAPAEPAAASAAATDGLHERADTLIRYY